MTLRAAVVVALAACAHDGDGAPADAPQLDAPPGCDRPALDAPWLDGELTRWLGELAVAPRATTTERAAARDYLAGELTAIGWSPRRHAYPGGENVYATIPATTGGEPAVVVGAHFDTVIGSPGANDNASGVAVVLAVARYLAATPCRRAPVVVALFDQEELGLFGARAFAATLDPATTRAVHTIDQVAWDGDDDRRFELELPTPALEAEWRAAALAVGAQLAATSTSGTDHEAFRDRGFAAVGLTEEYVAGDTSPFRHQAGDTATTVAAGYLALAAKLTAAVVLDEIAP
jgi:Peptidase family M28